MLFILNIITSVITHCICKLLDKHLFNDKKPDEQK